MSVAFPSGYYLTKDADFEIDLGVAHDTLDDGSLQVRVLSDTVYSTISCELPWLDSSESIALVSFLTTNRAEEITMTVDDVNYIGRVTSNPRKTMMGNRYKIRFDYYCREV